MNKIIKIIIILCFLMCPIVVADQLEQNAFSQVVQKEVNRGNKVILDKIQTESDLCYKNVEDSATKYFYELREDFKVVFWLDRIVTFIGMYISFVLAFLTSYFYQRKLERKKEVLKLSTSETKNGLVIERGNNGR